MYKMKKPILLSDLKIGDSFKYGLEDKGTFTILEKSEEHWIKTQRMCGRISGDFPNTKVYQVESAKQYKS